MYVSPTLERCFWLLSVPVGNEKLHYPPDIISNEIAEEIGYLFELFSCYDKNDKGRHKEVQF